MTQDSDTVENVTEHTLVTDDGTEVTTVRHGEVVSQGDKIDRNIDADYEYVRDNFKDLIEYGRDGIVEMLEVARQTEHPRSYEVLSKLIRDVGEINEKLLGASKDRQELAMQREEKAVLSKEGKPSSQHLYVGTVADLQKMLAKPSNKFETSEEDS